MGGSRCQSGKKLIEKSSQNSPILVLIFWFSVLCVCCVYIYTLLKGVGHYDMSVLSMSVMGFQKNLIGDGWSELYPVLFRIFRISFNLAKPLPKHDIQSVAPLKVLYTSPPDRSVHADINSTSLGSILAMLQLLHEDYSLYIFPPVSIAERPKATYSFRQLSELGRSGENKNAQASKWQQM